MDVALRRALAAEPRPLGHRRRLRGLRRRPLAADREPSGRGGAEHRTPPRSGSWPPSARRCRRSARSEHPMYLFQGRVDFAFDLAQATRAFARLGGPKKLYAGNFGHPPSTFPGPDSAYVPLAGHRLVRPLPEGNRERRRDEARGDREAGLAHRAQGARPACRRRSRRRSTLAGPRRSAAPRSSPAGPRPLQVPLETWGSGTAFVTVPKLSSYPRLVVTVLAGNQGRQPWGRQAEGRRQPRAAGELLRLRAEGDAAARDGRPLVAGRPDRLPRLRGRGVGDDRADQAPAPDPRQAGVRMKRVALLLALVLASTAGAATTADPGVTAKKILIGGTVPLSGEASAFGAVGPGAKAYFAYVNAKGGVHGRTIDYRFYDDSLRPRADRAADTEARRAGQGLRDLQLRRHREQQGDPAVPEPAQGAAALRRRRCAGDVPAHALPVDDGLPPELRRRGRRLRAPSRQDPQGGEDRRPLPERRPREGHDERPRASDRRQGPSDRREGELRVHRHRRLLADRRPEGRRRRHVHALRDAEVRDPGLCRPPTGWAGSRRSTSPPSRSSRTSWRSPA